MPQLVQDLAILLVMVSNACYNRFLKFCSKRSKLGDRIPKEISEVSRQVYAAQKNCCVNFSWKTKRVYFANIKINNIADNEKVWQTVKPCSSDKMNHEEAINLTDTEVTLPNDEKIQKRSVHVCVTLSGNLTLLENPSIPSSKHNIYQN